MFKRFEMYLLNLWDALLGREKRRNEYFVTSDGVPVQTSAAGAIAAFGVSFLFILVISFLSAYGAAKLSYCYNVSIGNADSAFIWSLLAFFFSGLYYPYYALFLNPLCAVKVGGRR